MPAETHDRELAALASALAALVPAPGRLDRDQVLFRAGQAMVAPPGWLWLAATAILAGTAATLGLVLLLQPTPQPVERMVYVRLESAPVSPGDRVAEGNPPPPVDSRSAENENRWRTQLGYVHLRQQVLRWGVDGLPDSPSAPPAQPPETVEKFLNSL
jgi:hypothetical protein